MKLTQTPLPGVPIVEPTASGDDRGWLTESFTAPKSLPALEAAR